MACFIWDNSLLGGGGGGGESKIKKPAEEDAVRKHNCFSMDEPWVHFYVIGLYSK